MQEFADRSYQMLTRLRDAGALPCPVTVIGARQDFMVGRDSVEATARAYGVRSVFLDGSGHMMQSEIPPARLAAILRSL